MSNAWFRLYSEILNDPKVQIMPEALRWRYVALLCLHCNDNYENRPDDEIAFALRVTRDEFVTARDEFIKRGLISEKSYKINGWEKRQFISDLKDPTAAERQKRYRERKRTDRNEAVTSRPPEQKQSRTDTEHKDNTSTEIVDRSSITALRQEDLDLNDFANACAVLAELLGKKKLAPQDQEVVGLWCSQFDMRNDVFPKIEIAFIKYFSKNKEPPKSAKYFNNMLIEQCKLPYPFAKNLGQKMRTV